MTGWTYTVTEHIENGRPSYQIEVPYTVGSLDLATVPVASPNPTVPSETLLHLSDVGTVVAPMSAVAGLGNLGSTSNGLVAHTGDGTWEARTLTSASGAALTVADGDGINGNPTLTVDATLAAMAGQNWAANALPIGTGADTVAQTSFAANTFPARGSTGDLVAKPITDNALTILTDPAASGTANLLGFLQAGTGAIVRTIQDELRRTIWVEQFANLAEGADWKAAIDYAIALAASIGGADVRLAAKDYGTSGSITIAHSGIGLIGQGAGQYPAAGFATSSNFTGTNKTRLVALGGFPAGQYVVDVNVTRGSQYALQGVKLQGIMIDCANIATHGLRWRGVKNSTLRDVLVYRPTTASTSLGVMLDTAQGAATGQTAAAGGASTITFQAALASPRDDWFNGATITTTAGTGAGQTRTVSDYVGATKVATVSSAWTTPPDGTTVFSITGDCLEGNGATQFNIFDGLTVWLGNSGNATGIEMNGDGIHDCNQNSYRNVRVIHADGPGVRMYNGDTEWVQFISTYAFGIGWGLECYGSDTTSYEGYCRQQVFEGCLFGGANAGGTSGTATAGAGLTMTLAGSASAVDDYYNGKFIDITGGTGQGQRRKVADYNGTTKVLLVAEAWTTNPDATSTYSIPDGGGVALYKGSYRSSRWHSFSDYETVGNGAGSIYAEDASAFHRTSEQDINYTDTDGFEMTLGCGNAFAAGTRSKLAFTQRLLQQPQEMSSIRQVDSGTEAAASGALAFFTRKAGAAPTESFRVTDGITIAGGTALKKLLRVAASVDFGSIAANSFLNAPSTITVTGAAVGDQVIVGLPATGTANGVMVKGYVSSADTVTLQALNVTTGAIDPGNASYAISVLGW